MGGRGLYIILLILFYYSLVVLNHHLEKKSTPPKFFAHTIFYPAGPISAYKYSTMKFILLSLLATISMSVLAQTNTAEKLAIKHIKDAQFSLSQCPKGVCGVDQLDIMREACASLKVARMYAQQSGNKELYKIARDNVRAVCGPNE